MSQTCKHPGGGEDNSSLKSVISPGNAKSEANPKKVLMRGNCFCMEVYTVCIVQYTSMPYLERLRSGLYGTIYPLEIISILFDR